MKVIKKGSKKRTDNNWSKKHFCTGRGNGGAGCWALLLLSASDFYNTYNCLYDRSHETYVTFRCPCCGVETDIDCNVPGLERPNKGE